MAGGMGGGSGGKGGTYGYAGGDGYYGSFGGGGGGGGPGKAGGAGVDRSGNNRVSGGTGPGAPGQNATRPFQGGGGGAGGANGTAAAPTGGTGGNGGNGAYGGGGGAGGYGYIATGAFTNSGTISGGHGGDGGIGTVSGGGGAGGDGGVGLYVTAPSSAAIANQGSIIGGDGGNGSTYGYGGDAVRTTTTNGTALNFTNSGYVYGGHGNKGGRGVAGGDGSSVYNGAEGYIKGGAQTGNAIAAPYGAVVGYGGGNGVEVGESSSVINTGSIAGGNSTTGQGGSGIYAKTGSYIYSSGTVIGGSSDSGRGGFGILGYRSDIVVNGGSVNGGDGVTVGGLAIGVTYGSVTVQDGAVTGGNGALGGPAIVAYSSTVTLTGGSVTGGNATADPSSSPYLGSGTGILGQDITLISDATVSGGTYGAARLNAVTFEGGANTLAIGDNAVFTGAVQVQKAVPRGADPSTPAVGSLTFDQGAAPGFSANARLSADLIGDGNIIKAGRGTLTLAGTGNTFSGGTVIQGGAIELAAGGAGGTGAISFQGRGAQTTQLILNTAAQNIGASFGNTLDAFGNNDSLDLRGFTFSMSTMVTYDPAGHILSVSDGTSTERFNLTNETPGANNMFYARRDADGSGTLITNAVCFTTGTLIRTMRGDVAVEALAVGDVVVTASGAHRPIRWIGHRTMQLAGHPEAQRHHPVRVHADAFGPGLPRRDLRLSPGHSIRVGVIEDLLVPVGSLVDGATITREAVETVTYWHVELDTHDVILAENLPCESFLDCGNRATLLEQEGEYDRAAAPRTPADFCLPYAASGLLVEALRHGLEARALRRGWRRGGLDPHLVVDGARVEPQADGDALTFVFPAAARTVVLASATTVPSHHGPELDGRRLGLSVSRLAFGDGLRTLHDLAACDPLLVSLFHPEEADAGCFHRFTTGEAALSPDLWAGCRGVAVLRLTVDPASGWRWIAPDAVGIAPLQQPTGTNVVALRSA